MNDKDVQRFFVRTKPTLVEGVRAFRAYLEKVFEAKGQKLDPAWHDDGPAPGTPGVVTCSP